MSEPTENFDLLEEVAGRFAGEVVLAKTGSDEGLIPAFALLTELGDAASNLHELADAVEVERINLETYLDDAKPFDDELLTRLRNFASWAPTVIDAYRSGRKVPVFSSVNASGSSGGGSGVETVESPDNAETEPQDVLLEIDLEENKELLIEFHAEALDHLEQIEAALLALDDDPQDRDGVDGLFRSFHTLKGNAGFLRLDPMQRLCHEVESLLDLARDGKLVLGPAIITAVLRSRDAVQIMVDQIYRALHDGVLPDKIVPISDLIRIVKRHASSASEESVAADRPIKFESAEEKEDIGGLDPLEDQNLAEVTAIAARKASTVRINTEKLDALMDVVGELVIVQGQIMASNFKMLGSGFETMERNIAQLTRITKELQHTAMSLRMVPIKPTFQKMERMVRDLAPRIGRKVHMTVEGESTEVDRSVVEEIADPLVHMVRNALDHGIEPEADRVKAGKPNHGQLTLKAYHQGGGIVIELSDDGKGIDSERILAKAKSQGVIAPEQTLTEAETYQLIFAPGFSTAKEVTEVSGRGVGMDVVRRNIEKLRGTIEVSSKLGQGSTFRIRLPLTMAIIDGLVLRVGEDHFVLPAAAVQMALRPVRENLVSVHGRGEVLDHRGKMLPLVRLHERFCIAEAQTDPTQGMAVLIEHAGRTSALLVDEMVKKQEVVIKNLGGFFHNIAGIAGGAILGDGNIALILDPPALVSAA